MNPAPIDESNSELNVVEQNTGTLVSSSETSIGPPKVLTVRFSLRSSRCRVHEIVSTARCPQAWSTLRRVAQHHHLLTSLVTYFQSRRADNQWRSSSASETRDRGVIGEGLSLLAKFNEFSGNAYLLKKLKTNQSIMVELKSKLLLALYALVFTCCDCKIMKYAHRRMHYWFALNRI